MQSVILKQIPSFNNSVDLEEDAMKRSCVGIWSCKRCKRTVAGGAWVFSTTAASSCRSAVKRLREVK
ncbi:60S ribosomal protein L37a [Papilio xuthus]|uniref:60S ribosomal protein L37a n=1 Tax=Papilio xuthus TaxID=66420 RepID=A0A194PVZ7_PAPXU|nr:60S ribosomal protein L37a [Papilio xuthus]